MTRIRADRVLESSTTTGTGDITLAAAIAGFRRFSSSMVVGDTCDYTIFAVDGTGVPTGDWESGRGTYSAANTLTRTTVQASSNSGSAVSFAAGSKYVMLSENATSLRRADFVPPLAAHFTSSHTTGSAIVATDDADAGLLVDGTGIGVNGLALIYVAPPMGGDWTVSARIRCETAPYDFFNQGLLLYEAATNRTIQIGFGNNGGLQLDTVRANNGVFSSRGTTGRISTMDMFFRVHYTFATTTFTTYYSQCGKMWTLYDTFGLTSFFAAACDGVGLGVLVNQNKFGCPFWEQSW